VYAHVYNYTKTNKVCLLIESIGCKQKAQQQPEFKSNFEFKSIFETK